MTTTDQVTILVAPYAPFLLTSVTSSTANTFVIGTHSFTVNEVYHGLDVGMHVHVVDPADVGRWMDGTITARDNVELTIDVDEIAGSGSYDNWRVNLTGARGFTGEDGPQGIPGAIAEAPGDGAIYGRRLSAWINIDTKFAPLASPALTGTPTSVTPATLDNSQKIATTAYVQNVVAGYQPADADLTALAAASGTNTIYYRSGAGAWTPVVMGSGVSFAGGTLSVTAGGGNVSNSGAPANGQVAQWINSNQIQGVAATSLGLAPLASPSLTGTPTAPTPATSSNDTTLATTAFARAAVSAVQNARSLFVANMSADQNGFSAGLPSQCAFNVATINQGGHFNVGLGQWVPPAGRVHLAVTIWCYNAGAVGSIITFTVYKNGSALRGLNTTAMSTLHGLAFSCFDIANGTDFYAVTGIFSGGGNLYASSTFEGALL